MAQKTKRSILKKDSKNDITASSANAVRTMYKNKEEVRCDLKSKEADGNRMNMVYDLFYRNANGTFTIVTEDDKVVIAALNLSFGKIFNMLNDATIEKLAEYVLETFPA